MTDATTPGAPPPDAPHVREHVLLCSCEGTMRLDADTVAAGYRAASITTARHLCRGELGRFRAVAGALGASDRLTVCCTQEAPLFAQVAEDEGLAPRLGFVNVRETAGWSSEGASAGPKMAALIAAATVAEPSPPAVTLESSGVALVYGPAGLALPAAERLKDRLDITVLLSNAEGAVPPRRAEFPVRRGRIVKLTGHLGAFVITIDGFGEPAVSSRAGYVFGAAHDGLISKADLVIDLSGGPALVTAPELRDGYLRADPARPVEVERLLSRAADLVGTFDKPRFITFRPELCAHSRSKITGCTRCLDLCPAGAIQPDGDHVAIDPHICGGCGACAAACPTGAAAYEVPRADVTLRRLRALLMAYAAAGGRAPVVLLHDGGHGEPLIDAAARQGVGLPAHVLPLAINEVGQIGLEAIVGAFAYGARGLRVLTSERPRHGRDGLIATLATADAILSALGYGHGSATILATDDPDAMCAELGAQLAPGAGRPNSSQFIGLGGKRDMLKLALRELHRVAPAPLDTIALPKGAAFGRVAVQADGCTLCLSCVAACPTGALGDAKDRPLLKFDESLCVQCGLCSATCPEKVITLEPRLDFRSFEAGAVTLKEEEPFCCIRCAKPFGTRSTIERVIAKLEDKHWMFAGAARTRLELLRMCEDCRVGAATDAALDPYGAPQRPAVRTTDDYLRERAEREAEMQKRIARGEA